MKNTEKIRLLTFLIQCGVQHEDELINTLERAELIKRNYYDYMITEPINCDEELKRLSDADINLCSALLTMLLREDHFSNGAFKERYENGQVIPLFERMIQLLQETNNTKMKSMTIKSHTGYGCIDFACEQHLTVSSTGRVYFKQTKPYFDDDFSSDIKTQLFIGRERANEILEKIYNYYLSKHEYCIVLDGGDFDLTMTFEDGKKIKFNNSMAYEKGSLDNEISDFIRERIPLENLMLLDGFNETWEDEE